MHMYTLIADVTDLTAGADQGGVSGGPVPLKFFFIMYVLK